MKKLLIVGAGGHGRVVAEVAQECGYSEIVFIDDHSDIAIGKISEIETFKEKYAEAFVGIGNNQLRAELISKLKKIGYKIPILIHPSAYVSKTATIKEGTIVEPKAIVNSGSKIGEGSVISVGAIVDHDVVIEKSCHVNAGAIVKAGGRLEEYVKLEAGEVKLGYESARVYK